MDSLERHFINRFQGGFPIVEQPFSSVAAALGTDEVTLISTVENLLESGILSRFGPLYDASRMGGGFTLAAMSVPDDSYDEVAGQVNSLDAVAHNYRRDHSLNMWFVIATDTIQALQDAITDIERITGLHVYNFPKLQEFYLGLWIELDSEDRARTCPVMTPSGNGDLELDDSDRRIIAATQAGLSLDSRPYAKVAEMTGLDEPSVMRRMNGMLDAGIIRRIGAVPNHYKLGLRSNGMSVWDVPDERLAELGKQVGDLDFVSHCYERPRHLPLWPYNLFAMVHGQGRDEVQAKVAKIAELLGEDCRQHDILFSSAILKKTGLRLAA